MKDKTPTNGFKKTVLIEKLDEGYVQHKDLKRTAVSDRDMSSGIYMIIYEALREHFKKSGSINAQVTIDIQYDIDVNG